jgi:hypothetical protein
MVIIGSIREELIRFVADSLEIELVTKKSPDSSKALHELGAFLGSVGDKLECGT